MKWLMERYHQPREVIKQHTRAIMECQATKEGDPKELRHIYTVWSQHTRALEELGHKMDPAILTCLLELKLDKQTLAKWKWETRTHVAVVPDIVDLLTFIKDQAAALESQPQEKKRSQVTSTEKKPHSFNKPVNSFATNVNPSQPRCIICPNDRHPLYVCDMFKNLSLDNRKSLLKQHNACLNCLRPGHAASRCNSSYRCKKCQKLHHTLLHVDQAPPSSGGSGEQVVTHSEVSAVSSTATTIDKKVIYMTCKIRVTGPDGSSATARALIDTGSGASFITERLARTIQLHGTKQKVQICRSECQSS